MICTFTVQDGILAALDGPQQIQLAVVRVLPGDPGRLLGGQALDALVGLQVVLDPAALPPSAFTHWKVCEPKPSMFR